MEEKKKNHQVNIVRLGAPRGHTNADSLELYDIGGYQVVTKKGNFKEGDLAVYVQPDSVVPITEPFRFIWEAYADPTSSSVLPERKRRVTVRRFRKEWSEGLLMPMTDFFTLQVVDHGNATHGKPEWLHGTSDSVVDKGDDVSDLLGITHYDPEILWETNEHKNEHAPRKFSRWPRSIKGWFYFILYKLGFSINGNHHGYCKEEGPGIPVYDVDALKNFKDAFEDGEQVVITEKIHGSNARYLYFDGKMYAGSRTLWKAPESNCVWRKALVQNPWIEIWCRANEGSTLYGEVVPTQKGFNYGCTEGQVKFFAFDILTPEGEWKKPYDGWNILGIEATPPVRYCGPFSGQGIAQFVDGPSLVEGAKHIKEGIVISPLVERHVRGLGRLQLKVVSNQFLDKDSK